MMETREFSFKTYTYRRYRQKLTTKKTTVKKTKKYTTLKEISWSKRLTYVGKSSCPQMTQPTLVILIA